MHFLPITRRGFLGQSAAAALTAASGSRVYGANEKLRVASIGVSGKGWSDLNGVAESPSVSVVALCDVDAGTDHLGKAAAKFASAKTYTDWRRVLDDAKTFDAVIVSTPDHMHAPIALPAMALGKHVFCQKPLTHTVFEARQMRLATKKAGVVTQMGNQIQSHEFYRTAVKLVRDGAVGKVKEVHSWQSGAMNWLRLDDRPAGADPVPAGLDWDHWLGVAPERPYKAKVYHPFTWRAWQAFSNGQLGDFGCHILDPVFTALSLTAPTTVRAEASPVNKEAWYRWSVVSYEFPGTAFTAGKTLKLTWYDGEGKTPAGLPILLKSKLPGSGSILIGEKDSLLIPHVGAPKLLQSGNNSFEKVPAINHYTSWVDACRGEGKTGSHFEYSGNLTEAVLLGTVAIRVSGETLTWDAAELRIANSAKANALLRKEYRKGWEPSWV